jgi:hypothetical protein
LGDDDAAAAWVEEPGGERVSSDRGDERLRVTRDGWVRVAVPLARDGSVEAAGWSCLPRKGRRGLGAPKPRSGEGGPCRIEPGRIFRLSEDFEVLEWVRIGSNRFE